MGFRIFWGTVVRVFSRGVDLWCPISRQRDKLKAGRDLSHSLKSLEGGYIEGYTGTMIGGMLGV